MTFLVKLTDNDSSFLLKYKFSCSALFNNGGYMPLLNVAFVPFHIFFKRTNFIVKKRSFN